MSARRLVVIGADAAGMSAASQALRVARGRGTQLEVLAFERTSHTSYSQCGVPYWVAGEVSSGDALVARTAEQHRANGIDLRLGHEVTALELDRREVVVREVDGGGEQRFGFDEGKLMIGGANGWRWDELCSYCEPRTRWAGAFVHDTVLTPIDEATLAAHPDARFIDFLPAGQALLGGVSDGTIGPLGFGKLIVASGEFDDFWLYVVGPLAGAIAAALTYRFFVLDPRWLPAQRPKDQLPG